MNIAIIGAGPAGCYTGYLLAKEGHEVSIYENHSAVGSPIQCTGILTSDFDQFGFPLDSFLVNTIDSIEVISPSNQKITIKQRDYIVCRIRFDNFFADKAKNAGAKIFVNHSFQRREGNTLVIKETENKREIQITPDIVIAADGPLSPTAKAYGFYHPRRENYYGVQAIVKGTFEPHTIKTYFGNEICPGLFAWIAPESSTSARVGVATLKNSKHYFDLFMKEHNFTAAEMQAGTIPVYHPKQKLHRENCYLVGDAAGYVKATTLGGLIPGLQQAEILARAIVEQKNYDHDVAPLRKKLGLHLKVHEIMARFSDKDWDTLISYVGQPKIQAIFEKYTRDNPIPLVSHALLKEPRFLRFGKYLR
ncbi:NAD(P)/FAD-dependent oxidoreductase [Candidatus Woesearchaeota archaeon]|nr:NAD(P)/FAD-dependent oxidoreductase [Candidatus Woesearchaeota archaeon]